MAQKNRLLTSQIAYLSYIERELDRDNEQVCVATWSLYSWATMSSPVSVVLRKLNSTARELRVPVTALAGPPARTASLGIARAYSAIEWRLSEESHAKYALFQLRGNEPTKERWRGAVGSANLVDSNQWNVSVVLEPLQAWRLARLHFNYWARATPLARINTAFADVSKITEATLTERNSV